MQQDLSYVMKATPDQIINDINQDGRNVKKLQTMCTKIGTQDNKIKQAELKCVRTMDITMQEIDKCVGINITPEIKHVYTNWMKYYEISSQANHNDFNKEIIKIKDSLNSINKGIDKKPITEFKKSDALLQKKRQKVQHALLSQKEGFACCGKVPEKAVADRECRDQLADTETKMRNMIASLSTYERERQEHYKAALLHQIYNDQTYHGKAVEEIGGVLRLFKLQKGRDLDNQVDVIFFG